MQLSVAEKESETHCLTMALPLQLINSIAQINGEVTHAYRELSVYAYSNIIGKLKSKILSICKELEKQYGNLDDYYIDFKNDDKEKEREKYFDVSKELYKKGIIKEDTFNELKDKYNFSKEHDDKVKDDFEIDI